MSEWTSLSCKESTKERFKELKGDKSQDEFLEECLNAYQRDNSKVKEDAKSLVNTLSHEDAKNIARREIEAIEKNTELLKDIDVVSRNQNVIGRIDDLEAELKSHFERELAR